MANYQGNNGSVKIKSGSDTLTAVADVRTWSVTVNRETVETTAMGDDYRKYLKGLQMFNGSMDIVYNDSESSIVATSINPDTDATVTVEFYNDAADGTKFVGEVIVTAFTVNASYDGLTTASVTFQGTGAPTVTNWVY
jgi:predicted secreted protein